MLCQDQASISLHFLDRWGGTQAGTACAVVYMVRRPKLPSLGVSVSRVSM